MAGVDEQELTYVVPIERVRECVSELLGRDSHPYFVAYLHLRSVAGRNGSLKGLKPSWAELGSQLEVSGAPSGTPFLRPFWSGERKAGQEWLNRNLAGSYAPSSLRQGQGPSRVVDTDAKSRFILRPEHWKLAREHLLFGKRLPAAAVSGFLFRDYGFVASETPNGSEGPDSSDLIAAFRSYYGYTDKDDDEFDFLFDSSWTGLPGPWLELLKPSSLDEKST